MSRHLEIVWIGLIAEIPEDALVQTSKRYQSIDTALDYIKQTQDRAFVIVIESYFLQLMQDPHWEVLDHHKCVGLFESSSSQRDVNPKVWNHCEMIVRGHLKACIRRLANEALSHPEAVLIKSQSA